jgi:tripartite-type tricarboxylate transporter receptor subunit TctC
MVCFIAALAASGVVAAQGFPSRSVTIVVPYPPGGLIDLVALRLNEALNHTTQDPQVRSALESRGATVIQGTPEDCLAFVRNEVEKWGPVVKRANVVPE